MAWETDKIEVPEEFSNEGEMLNWFIQIFTSFYATHGTLFIDYGEAERILAAFWRLRPEGLNANTKERKDDSI